MFSEAEKKEKKKTTTKGVKIMIPAARNMINTYSISNTVQEVLQQLEGEESRKIYKERKKKVLGKEMPFRAKPSCNIQ